MISLKDAWFDFFQNEVLGFARRIIIPENYKFQFNRSNRLDVFL